MSRGYLARVPWPRPGVSVILLLGGGAGSGLELQGMEGHMQDESSRGPLLGTAYRL